MRLKAGVIVVGVLIIVQFLMFNYFLSQDNQTIDLALKDLEGRRQQLTAEKADLQNRIKELKSMISAIPPWLLTGFEDPETGFVEFLDFLQSDALKAVKGTVTVKSRDFSREPIPLHQTAFSFKYQFTTTYEAEKLINYLLFQERYPLQVTGFKAKKSEAGVVGGDLSLNLLIPARLQLSLPSSSEKVESR